MKPTLDDTIAAISTAPGRAGIAVVRISGPAARDVARRMGVEDLEPRVVRLSVVRHPDGGDLDRALVTWFPAPGSFTGDDVVEISGHGGSLVPALVLEAAHAAGARAAEPGEFTRRAYLNGKLDLVQAEATLDLIDATGEVHHRAALFQLEGGLSARVTALRTGVVGLQALLAYDIDFPEEDDGPVPRERILEAAGELAADLEALVCHAPEGERLAEGAVVVLAGAPNVGKSSIFNSLLGSERAIVTEIPGTTRDAIEAATTVEGFPFRLVDTAGMRDTREPVERMGIEVARRSVSRADIVLLCVETGHEPGAAERELGREAAAAGARVLHVRTKADLGPDGVVAGSGRTPEETPKAPATAKPHVSADPTASGGDGPGSAAEPIQVSVRTADGLAALRDALVETSFAGLRASREPALVTRKRHTRALGRALEEIGRFRETFGRGHPAEIAGTHLEEAARALEELIGITDVEDVLDAIFRSFCVGK